MTARDSILLGLLAQPQPITVGELATALDCPYSALHNGVWALKKERLLIVAGRQGRKEAIGLSAEGRAVAQRLDSAPVRAPVRRVNPDASLNSDVRVVNADGQVTELIDPCTRERFRAVRAGAGYHRGPKIGRLGTVAIEGADDGRPED